MSLQRNEHGEVHCLLCGRYLADIEAGAGGRMRLQRPRNGDDPERVLRVIGGRLHCLRCGGRAMVEWDLMASGSATMLKAA